MTRLNLSPLNLPPLNLSPLTIGRSILISALLASVSMPIHAAGHVDNHAAGASASPKEAAVYFISPVDGEQLSSPVTVRFGLVNMGVAPAGTVRQNTGHHHLLIDMDTLPALNQPLPATEQIIHFGGGQTETTIELEPGKHSLQLLLGDHMHIPHNPPLLSDSITIEVK